MSDSGRPGRRRTEGVPRGPPRSALAVFFADVAVLLHVSPKTVTRWAKDGKLPHSRTLGGHRRFPAEAIEKLDEILSVPGVDAAYIGPSDLSLAIGLPPRADNPDPKHVSTVARIREACARHGVVPGIHCNSAAFVSEKIGEGFKMVMLTSDSILINRGATAELAAVKSEVH